MAWIDEGCEAVRVIVHGMSKSKAEEAEIGRVGTNNSSRTSSYLEHGLHRPVPRIR